MEAVLSVWEEGTYKPIEDIKGKKKQKAHLLQQLEEGSVKIKLHGKKLKGEYALVKMNGMGENGWLLIKHKDEFASVKDVTKNDKSVLSGQTIATMEIRVRRFGKLGVNKKWWLLRREQKKN